MTTKKLYAALDEDMVVLASFASVTDALDYFEKTEQAIMVVRTARAVLVNKKVWQWQEVVVTMKDQRLP